MDRLTSTYVLNNLRHTSRLLDRSPYSVSASSLCRALLKSIHVIPRNELVMHSHGHLLNSGPSFNEKQRYEPFTISPGRVTLLEKNKPRF